MDTGTKPLSDFQDTAECLINEIFDYLPPNIELYSDELQSQIVLKAITQCTFALQIITGVQMATASEIAHTTYERMSGKGQGSDDEPIF